MILKTVRGRIDAAWLSWRNISGLLQNNIISLKYRSGIYDACIRPVLLYGSKTWASRQKLVETLVRNENKMLRRLVDMKFIGQRSNQLVEICGIPRLETRLRNQRLRWFGHILKKPKNSLTLRVYNMNLDGRKPVGRPKKTWKKCVEEDLEILGL